MPHHRRPQGRPRVHPQQPPPIGTLQLRPPVKPGGLRLLHHGCGVCRQGNPSHAHHRNGGGGLRRPKYAGQNHPNEHRRQRVQRIPQLGHPGARQPQRAPNDCTDGGHQHRHPQAHHHAQGNAGHQIPPHLIRAQGVLHGRRQQLMGRINRGTRGDDRHYQQQDKRDKHRNKQPTTPRLMLRR